jgi:hypothetical protein
VTLIRVLCHHRYPHRAGVRAARPDLAAMVRDYDAACSLATRRSRRIRGARRDEDRSRRRVDGDDRLPFIYAAWTGGAGAIGAARCASCRTRRRKGRVVSGDCREYGSGDAPRRSGPSHT